MTYAAADFTDDDFASPIIKRVLRSTGPASAEVTCTYADGSEHRDWYVAHHDGGYVWIVGNGVAGRRQVFVGHGDHRAALQWNAKRPFAQFMINFLNSRRSED